MRLTFAATMRDTYDGIATAAERMIKYQRQISTGIRVAQPSDDPSATATTISEKAAKASYEQYVQAGDSAESRLSVADTLLSDIIDKLSAARTAILSAQGSETTDAQRENGAQSLASLRDAILEDVTTSFRGTYMFGGAAGTVRPYSKDVNGVVLPYAGSTREVTVDIDRNRPVTVVFNGDAIVTGNDATDLFTAFDNAIVAARGRGQVDRKARRRRAAGRKAAITTSSARLIQSQYSVESGTARRRMGCTRTTAAMTSPMQSGLITIAINRTE